MTTRQNNLAIVSRDDANSRARCALEVVTAISDLFKFVPDVETLDPQTLPALGHHLDALCDEIRAGLEKGAA